MRPITLAAAVMLPIAMSGCSSPSTTSMTSTSTSVITVTETAAAQEPAPSTPPPAVAGDVSDASSDQGWRLIGTPALSLSYGTLTGHARIRNDSATTTAAIQLTYNPTGPAPIVLMGTASNVAPGKTVMVEVVSTDKVKTPPKGTPEFRVTAAF